MYSRKDLKIFSPLETVRRLESWYFDDEGFSAARAVEYIRAEARTSGVETLDVTEIDGWWILAANQDWLPSEEDGLRPFRELVHFPEAGVNASRSEILLTAFARVVITAREGRATVVSDREHRADEAMARFAQWLTGRTRVIVFLP